MKTPTKASLLLTACAALFACEQPEDFGDPKERLDSLEVGGEIGLWPPPNPAVEPAPSAAELAPPSVEIPAQASVGVVEKVKTPAPEHLIGWVRWATSLPQADGPVADPTGDKCAMGQAGNFWYLAGTFGGAVNRECDIPAGKTLVFPLINRWWMAAPEHYPDDEAIEATKPLVLDWFEQSRLNTCSLTLRIDGYEVRDSFDELYDDFYILVDDPFEADLVWDVPWTEGGPMPSIGDGHYAVVTPLPPGDHVIELGGEVCGDAPFSTAATYQLHVGP